MRLKAPPISDNESADASSHYVSDANHVMAVMDAFMSEVAYLDKSWVQINWDFEYHDNLKGFQKAAGKLIKKDAIKSSEHRALAHKSGKCTLILDGGKSIPLDPIIIPLYNGSRKTRLASLAKFGGHREENVCPMVYRELIGDGVDFNTNDKQLQNDIYYKKGQVAEDPNFSYQFRIGDQDTVVQLYKGDIFDLNFLEGMTDNKVSAMVNILYVDLDNKTRLFQSLKNLAGDEVVNELKNQAVDNRKLKKNRVYTTGSGKLKFDYIIHCPIYDTNEEENSGKSVITAAIDNILKTCQEKKVDWLILPAMGSFYAGHIRQEVALTWCEQIKEMARLTNNSLKRIIFSFINEETCEVYRNCISNNNTNHFAACHLPVSRMHSYMDTSVKQKNRLNYALNLSGYLLGFVVAMSLRALMWEKVNNRINGEPFVMTPEAEKFVSNIRRRGGLDHEKGMKPKFIKSMNPGDWRSLAKLGYDAIKTSAWHFDIWYQDSPAKKLKVFKSFLTNGKDAVDFPNIRNRMAHSPLFDIHESDLTEYAKEAVKGINGVIENMPFLYQERNEVSSQ
jgi:O-acetyl-ADP-ribose deacetylase (regulator of RNase III)